MNEVNFNKRIKLINLITIHMNEMNLNQIIKLLITILIFFLLYMSINSLYLVNINIFSISLILVISLSFQKIKAIYFVF